MTCIFGVLLGVCVPFPYGGLDRIYNPIVSVPAACMNGWLMWLLPSQSGSCGCGGAGLGWAGTGRDWTGRDDRQIDIFK